MKKRKLSPKDRLGFYTSTSLKPQHGADLELLAEIGECSVSKIIRIAVVEHLEKKRRIINRAWNEVDTD